MSKRVVAALAVAIIGALGIAAWAVSGARGVTAPEPPTASAALSLPADRTVAIATEAVPTGASETATALGDVTDALRPGVVSVLTEEFASRLPRAVEGDLSGTVEGSDARRRTVDVRVSRFAASYVVSKNEQPAWLVWPAGSLVRVSVPDEPGSTVTARWETGRAIVVRVRVSVPKGRMTVTIVPASVKEGASGP